MNFLEQHRIEMSLKHIASIFSQPFLKKIDYLGVDTYKLNSMSSVYEYTITTSQNLEACTLKLFVL